MEQTPKQAQEANRLWFRFNNSLKRLFICYNFRPQGTTTYTLHPIRELTECHRTPTGQKNGKDQSKGYTTPFQAPADAGE